MYINIIYIYIYIYMWTTKHTLIIFINILTEMLIFKEEPKY